MQVDTCHIASPAANDVRSAFQTWAREQALEAYSQRTGEGFLRHLVVREGRRTGQLLAMLVTAPGAVPAPERLSELLPAGVVGVVHAVNDGVAEVTGGLESVSLFGGSEFEERIGELTLRLSAGAFMQTNSEMCEVLYAHAIEQARLRPDDVAWDLYCGAGAIGLLAAPHVQQVVGVEIAAESIARARDNAARNGIGNAEFVTGDVARELRPLLERAPRPTIVFVDPPRAGLTPRALRRVLELAPERISYVSCNPTTLAPNARPARGRRLPARPGAAGRHVPAHAPHRVCCGLHASARLNSHPVQDPGQLRHALGDARRWPREVRVRIDAHRGRGQVDRRGLRLRPGAVEPARRHHDQLRPFGGDRLPGGRVRRLSRPPRAHPRRRPG